MAWTAEVVKVVKDPAAIKVDLRYTDGVAVVTESFTFTGGDLDDVKRRIKRSLDKLEANDSLKAAVNTGPIDVTPGGNPPDPTETNFKRDVSRLKKIVEAESLGITVPGGAGIKATLISNIETALAADIALAKFL